MDEQNKSKREDVCPSHGKLDLTDVRAKMDDATAHDAAEKTGPEYWRSLEELAGSEDFQDALHREFPKGASEWVDSVSRRGFLKVWARHWAGRNDRMRQAPARADRSLRAPAGRRDSRAADVLRHGVHARRIRQPAVGGKPSRPSYESRRQRSASGFARRHRIFAQASLLGLYDPDRSQSVMSMGDRARGRRFSARSAVRLARRKR